MSERKPAIAQVAIDTPLKELFDYRIPDSLDLCEGQRVVIPFGRREVIGIVFHCSDRSEVDPKKLKFVKKTLEPFALLDATTLSVLRWAARYYHHPIGQVAFTSLPPKLRKNHPLTTPQTVYWSAIGKDPEVLVRAPRQLALWRWLSNQPKAMTQAQIEQAFPKCRAILKRLAEREFIQSEIREALDAQASSAHKLPTRPSLNQEQREAITALTQSKTEYHCALLDGVTGSGKTEVYFALIEQALNRKKQVLVLVPEIGLTPQLLIRLQQRFSTPISTLHSALNDSERLYAWDQVRKGESSILLGTRSAVFTPMPHLGLIIIDEEHDASFKQFEGFLYHSRDVAIYRAYQQNIPILLGSATPSFESLLNAQNGKYQHLRLRKRAQETPLPALHTIDMRGKKTVDGLGLELRNAIQRHLEQGSQVLLFLNRRGFAPALLCHDCGWVANCRRCDANLTYHHSHNTLRCHHCDQRAPFPSECPECASNELVLVGEGTQRIEQQLGELFPQYACLRVDRDSVSKKGELQRLFREIHDNQYQIIIGTQMLSKGHDFPNVTMVGILDMDYGIYSADFRALERAAQLLVQVAGRSGRRKQQGEVFIQTHAPDHPLLNILLNENYHRFAEHALQLRQTMQLPPYTFQVTVRAKAQQLEHAMSFLHSARRKIPEQLTQCCTIYGPIPSNMERKAGYSRAYLLLNAKQRGVFGAFLEDWTLQLGKLPSARKVRWSIDVDPLEYD